MVNFPVEDELLEIPEYGENIPGSYEVDDEYFTGLYVVEAEPFENMFEGTNEIDAESYEAAAIAYVDWWDRDSGGEITNEHSDGVKVRVFRADHYDVLKEVWSDLSEPDERDNLDNLGVDSKNSAIAEFERQCREWGKVYLVEFEYVVNYFAQPIEEAIADAS